MSDITVILNGYKRPYTLKQQYDAITNQTVKPAKIMLWKNGTDNDSEFPYDQCPGMIISRCSENLGVWARFAFGLMARTKYVCFFDDDTIPGSRWFENCLSTMSTYRGCLTTKGLIFDSPNGYGGGWSDFGWNTPNSKIQPVDLPGHAWFMERDWLSEFWREIPDPKYWRCGEDIHVAYVLQKYLGLGTYVPPHPIDDTSLWGATPDLSQGYGGDSQSTAAQDGLGMMNEYIMSCRARGYRFLFER